MTESYRTRDIQTQPAETLRTIAAVQRRKRPTITAVQRLSTSCQRILHILRGLPVGES